jgi:hypothetical protein
MQANVSQCSSCGADVYWLGHERTHKPAPIDSEPTRYGRVVADFGAGTYRMLGKGEPVPLGGLLFAAHVATCPFAGQHRQQKASRPS